MGLGLNLTVLGCCGSYPGPGGACSGYLLDDGTTRVWLDAGSGSLANLQRHVSLDQVDAVVLTHEHPDHWSDLEGYVVALQHVFERSGAPVYAPAGLRDHTYHDSGDVLAWNDITEGDRVSVGDLHFRFSRTDHGPETLAVRVDAGGRSVAYSADTGPGWSLEALGPDLDLALCEATLPVDEEGTSKHLSARQAGEQARAAGVGQLVLTHLWPTVDVEQSRTEGSEAFGREVAVATTGARYEV